MATFPLTVAIATFNSEKRLTDVLQAIRQQEIYGSKLELLIIDGGSTDETLKIAKEFQALIIKNPKTEPVYAKYLAFHKAQSTFLMYLDHDEVLQNPQSVAERLALMHADSKVAATLVSGYVSPAGLPFVNRYINEFGDPFSFFIYRLSKSHTIFLNEMKKRYTWSSEKHHTVFRFSESDTLPLIELCAAATIINRSSVQAAYNREITPEDIPHFFYVLLENDFSFALHHRDPLLHYSSDTISSYLAKIRWRIKNNIFRPEALGKSGFTGRQAYLPPLQKLKKYLFPIYGLTLIGPTLDAVWLAITRRDPLYVWHIFYCFFTASTITRLLIQKMLGYHAPLMSYDEKTKI